MITKKCEQCGIPVKRYPSELAKAKHTFCSSTCAVTYSNARPGRKYKPRTKVCAACGDLICKNRSYCRECIQLGRHLRGGAAITSRTMAEINKYDGANKYSSVRYHAIKVASVIPDVCAAPGCEYTNHVEVCHKKPISAFPDTAYVSEVNDINNLVKLCPNHHWDFDHGLLKV